jgi:hypothetical protein
MPKAIRMSAPPSDAGRAAKSGTVAFLDRHRRAAPVVSAEIHSQTPQFTQSRLTLR